MAVAKCGVAGFTLGDDEGEEAETATEQAGAVLGVFPVSEVWMELRKSRRRCLHYCFGRSEDGADQISTMHVRH